MCRPGGAPAAARRLAGPQAGRTYPRSSALTRAGATNSTAAATGASCMSSAVLRRPGRRVVCVAGASRRGGRSLAAAGASGRERAHLAAPVVWPLPCRLDLPMSSLNTIRPCKGGLQLCSVPAPSLRVVAAAAAAVGCAPSARALAKAPLLLPAAHRPGPPAEGLLAGGRQRVVQQVVAQAGRADHHQALRQQRRRQRRRRWRVGPQRGPGCLMAQARRQDAETR